MIGGYRVFMQDILLISSDGLGRKKTECSSRTFITMYQTIWCPNPDLIMNPHQCEHITSCATQYLKNEALMEMTH
jgi:hypothetical protein